MSNLEVWITFFVELGIPFLIALWFGVMLHLTWWTVNDTAERQKEFFRELLRRLPEPWEPDPLFDEPNETQEQITNE